MNRRFAREIKETELVFLPEKKRIVVAGMTPGAGASILTVCLAWAAARQDQKRRVSVMEMEPSLYLSLGMEQRFAGRPFVDFPQELRLGRRTAGLRNLDEGINWALLKPHTEALTVTEALRLFSGVEGDVVLCDLGSRREPELLKEADVIVFVIDPLPSGLLKEETALRHVKNLAYNGKHVCWVINKYNKGVDAGELKRFLNVKAYETIPFIPAEFLYAAEYNCRIPLADRRIGEIAGAAAARLVECLGITDKQGTAQSWNLHNKFPK